MHGLNIVGVQFRRAGKIYDFAAGGIECRVGDRVVVETEKGPATAEVCAISFRHPLDENKKKLKAVLRKASHKGDIKPSRYTTEFVNDFCKDKIKSLELDMRILKSEVLLGGAKLVVYFTSPGRVDFRELVKELAAGLKTRVELKQVGARDETKLLGGLGICGREYCCSSFLREFVPVSIKMAKNQNLALNPNKVSGGCGRLLCCLTYENETYSHLRTKLPPIGAQVRLLEVGEDARVIKCDLLNQCVLVETASGNQSTVKLAQLEVLSKPGQKREMAESEELKEWGDELDLTALTAQLEENKKAPEKRGTRPPRQASSEAAPKNKEKEGEGDAADARGPRRPRSRSRSRNPRNFPRKPPEKRT